MEIDYMKGITTSNAHFLELDEVGPDCSVSDEYSWVPPPNRKTIWSEIYNVHLCNKYHFCQICRFGGKLETSYYFGGTKYFFDMGRLGSDLGLIKIGEGGLCRQISFDTATWLQIMFCRSSVLPTVWPKRNDKFWSPIIRCLNFWKREKKERG